MSSKHHQPEESSEQTSEKMNALCEKFSSLTAHFLAQSVPHSVGWRKAYVSHQEDQKEVLEVYDQLRKKGLLYLLQEHADPQTGTPYSSDNPQGVSLVAEEFDQRSYVPESIVEQSLKLLFAYRKNERSHFQIVLHMPAGQLQINSYIYDDRFAGVGYEGHDHRNHELQEEDLENFYDLLEQLAQEAQRKSPTECVRDAAAQQVKNALHREEKKS